MRSVIYSETLNAFQYRREVPVEQLSELVRTVLSTWPERAATAALQERDLSGIPPILGLQSAFDEGARWPNPDPSAENIFSRIAARSGSPFGIRVVAVDRITREPNR